MSCRHAPTVGEFDGGKKFSPRRSRLLAVARFPSRTPCSRGCGHPPPRSPVAQGMRHPISTKRGNSALAISDTASLCAPRSELGARSAKTALPLPMLSPVNIAKGMCKLPGACSLNLRADRAAPPQRALPGSKEGARIDTRLGRKGTQPINESLMWEYTATSYPAPTTPANPGEPLNTCHYGGAVRTMRDVLSPAFDVRCVSPLALRGGPGCRRARSRRPLGGAGRRPATPSGSAGGW